MREPKLPKISKNCQVGGDNKYPIGGRKQLRANQNFQKAPILRVKQNFQNLKKIAELEGTINTPPFAPFFNIVIYTMMDIWRGCDDLSLLWPDP